MIEALGLNPFNPAVSIKEIAKQISDRDNGVRSAALNTITIAFQIVGEQVYKYTGKVKCILISLQFELVFRFLIANKSWMKKIRVCLMNASKDLRNKRLQLEFALPPAGKYWTLNSSSNNNSQCRAHPHWLQYQQSLTQRHFPLTITWTHRIISTMRGNKIWPMADEQQLETRTFFFVGNIICIQIKNINFFCL